MKLKRVHHFAWCLYLLAAAVLVLLFFVDPLTELLLCLFAILFCILFMTAYILCLRFYRCPNCDQLLRLGVRIPHKCKNCGADLTDAT